MSDSTDSAPTTFDNSAILASMEKVRGAAAPMIEAMGAIGESLSGLAGQFVIPAMETFAKGINDAMEQGRQFADQARQASQSVSTMVELKEAFESAGVSGNHVTGALSELAKAMNGVDEKGKPATDAFAKLGLSIGNLKKMNGVQQFQAIIKGLQGLPDAAGRAAAAQKIFGDKAREIMGVLNDPQGFNEAIEGSTHYAQTMQQNAKAMEALGRSAEDVRFQFNDFYAQIAGALAPALTRVNSLVKSVNVAGIGESLADGMKLVGQALKQGDLHNLVYLELKQGFMDSINFLAGTLTQISSMFSAAIKSVFNESLMKGLAQSFKGVAEAFGAALLDAMRPQISYVQQSMSYYLDRNQAGSNAQAADDNAKAMAAEMRRNLIAAAEAGEKGDTKEESSRNASAKEAKKKMDVSSADAQRWRDMANMSYTDYMAAHGSESPTWFGKSYDQNVIASQTDLKEGTVKISTAFQPLLDQWNVSMDKIAQTNIYGDQLASNQAKLNDLLKQLGSAYGSPLADQDPPPNKNTNSLGDQDQPQKKKQAGLPGNALSLKPIESDHFAKLGLFIGGAPQTPGLSEARRTANATEKALKTLDTLVVVTKSLSGFKSAVYAE